MGKLQKTVLFIALGVLVTAASFGAGFAISERSSHPAHGLPPEFRLVDEAWGVLSADFVNREALDPSKLSRGAVGGMVQALGDPYTTYFNPQDNKLAQENLEGKFEGIGAWVSMREKELTVVSVIEGSPAEKVGVRAGDKIVEVNGEPTSGMSLPQAVLKVRGPRGTKVRLSVIHRDELEPVEIEVIRAEVKLVSVRSQMIDGIAHIKIIGFSENTCGELASVLWDSSERDAKAIVLDLRNNYGGLLPAVVDVASQFLPRGTVILYQVNNDGKRKVCKVEREGLALQIPMTVLVNKASASGAEVLAGALQYHERALLIGTTTFGKGSVCILHSLKDGSGLYVTTARWLTPGNEQIEGKGLAPDIQVEVTEKELEQGKDAQLQCALDHLRALLNEQS